MRYITFFIAVMALGGVAYISLEQPSHAAVFSDDAHSASRAVLR